MILAIIGLPNITFLIIIIMLIYLVISKISNKKTIVNKSNSKNEGVTTSQLDKSKGRNYFKPVSLLGNCIWFTFGGFFIALEYLLASILLFVTIIGIPFAFQTIKMMGLSLFPFGKEVVRKKSNLGCLNLIMNIIWIIIGGFWICISHIGLGVLFCISIVGIPFGMQHFKLAGLALMPFGTEIRS